MSQEDWGAEAARMDAQGRERLEEGRKLLREGQCLRIAAAILRAQATAPAAIGHG